jgi:hypothetical protein
VGRRTKHIEHQTDTPEHMRLRRLVAEAYERGPGTASPARVSRPPVRPDPIPSAPSEGFEEAAPIDPWTVPTLTIVSG